MQESFEGGIVQESFEGAEEEKVRKKGVKRGDGGGSKRGEEI